MGKPEPRGGTPFEKKTQEFIVAVETRESTYLPSKVTLLHLTLNIDWAFMFEDVVHVQYCS